jgi:divalent metal cation (Fe/Co/Zn/Cd) transporter
MVENRIHLIKLASIISLTGNFVLAGLMIGAGLYAGSLSVVGNGIDSSIDVFIAIMTLLVSRVLAKPAD